MLLRLVDYLYLVGILVLTMEATSDSRPHLPTKKQVSPAEAERRTGERIRTRSGTDRREEDLVKRELERDMENLTDEGEDARWRRDEWAKQDFLANFKQDPVIARQEDFERWLRKRGSVCVEQDPEAARVAARQAELQELLQQLYEAQAAVKMETGEVSRTQQVAQEAQTALEEATNKVRMLSADLQSAQEGAAAAAMRAHTAQLQLSAHDQLMFTARQRVDALSAQMVSVQAELAAAQQAFTLNNSSHLLEAQGRALEPVMIQQEKIMGRPVPGQRAMFPVDSLTAQNGLVSVLGSPMSNLLEDKHGENLSPMPSPVNRQNFNYMYPQ